MHKDRNCPTENLGKSEQCQGCPNQSICSTEKIDESIPIIAENVSHFKLIIVVMSGKGGVGKSTVTRNIAEYLSQKNKKVLLLDLDLSGPSIPKMTSSEGQSLLESNNIIYPVKLSDNLGCISTGYISNEELYTSSFKTNTIRKILMNSSLKEYEILVIDTPPNITDEHLGIVNYLQVSFAIIVTTPQMISFQDVKRQFTFCNKNNINILGVIENMKGFQCGKCNCVQNIFYDSDIQEQCKKYNVPYLGCIPLKMEYAKRGDEGSAIDDNIFEEVIDKILKFN